MSLRFFYALIFIVSHSAFATEPRPQQPRPTAEDELGIIDSISGRGLLQSFGRPAAPSLTYSGSYTPQGTKTAFNIVNLSADVYRSERDSISLYATGAELHLENPPRLPNGAAAPGDLGRAEIGARYSHKLREGHFTGGSLGFGSASDRPFATADSATVSANYFYGFPSGERSIWVLSVFYSNNNPISDLVPIPAFMYMYRTENFVGIFGVPFAFVRWRFHELWMFSASMFGAIGGMEMAYGQRRAPQIYSGLRAQQQSYLRAQRANSDDRIRENEKRLYAGVRFRLYENLGLDFQTGYAFDRFISESDKHVVLSAPENAANLGNSWYVAAGARLNF